LKMEDGKSKSIYPQFSILDFLRVFLRAFAPSRLIFIPAP
jgi:hypothetical protein